MEKKVKMESINITQVSHLSDQEVFFAFACISKSKTACVIVVFSCFFFLLVFQEWTDKSFSNNVSLFITQKTCDQDWAFFNAQFGKWFVSVFFIVKFRVSDNNMSCALETNCNNGPYQGDMKSCSSTNKSMISSLLHCL